MATIKQKKAIEKIVENNGNVSKSMREVGYSKETAKNPKSLTESKGFKELIKKYLPNKDLLKVHKAGLKAGKKIFKNNNETGKIEEVGTEPDFAVRHKYLDTGYKLKGSYAPEKLDIRENLTIEDVKGKLKNI